MILLDTSVLSLALRRGRASAASEAVRERLGRLILEDVPLAIPGIVLQEVLSGVPDERQFAKLRQALQGFPVVLAQAPDHVRGAALFNTCRQHGVAATVLDCLIAALAIGRGARLWTLDQDFSLLARYAALQLFQP